MESVELYFVNYGATFSLLQYSSTFRSRKATTIDTKDEGSLSPARWRAFLTACSNTKIPAVPTSIWISAGKVGARERGKRERAERYCCTCFVGSRAVQRGIRDYICPSDLCFGTHSVQLGFSSKLMKVLFSANDADLTQYSCLLCVAVVRRGVGGSSRYTLEWNQQV